MMIVVVIVVMMTVAVDIQSLPHLAQCLRITTERGDLPLDS